MSFGIPVRNGLGVGLLASTFLSTRNSTPFSPASLFTTGEQGAWYDPSDLSTLYQDSAGTTPVTAAAQSVGLMLDKSQGLVLGPEVVTNGTFDSGTTGWTAGFGTTVSTFTASGGVATLTAVGVDSSPRFVATLTGCVVGSYYLVSFTEAGATNTGQDQYVVWTSSSNGTGGTIMNQTGPGGWTNETKTFYLPATATTMYVAFGLAGATNGDAASIDNISVKELTGNHATQSNSAQRPTYGVVPATGRRNLLTYTEQFDNAAWTKAGATITPDATTAPDGTLTADKLVETATSGGHQAYSGVYTTITGTVTYSLRVKAAERSWVLLADNTGGVYFDVANGTVGTASGGRTGTITATSNGFYICAVTGTWSGTQQVYFAAATGNGTSSYAGTAGSGLFFWGAQLETGTTATAYQRVVSSFDVTEAGVQSLSYVSFDGTDDGMLTNTITPGIDKAQIFAGVRKLSDVDNGIVAELTTSAFTTAGGLYMIAPQNTGASGNFGFFSRGTSGPSTAAITSTDLAPTTAVLTGQGDIAADTMTIRRNGIQEGAITQNQGSGNYATAPLYIGRRAGTSLPFNGQIYSMIVRFGATLSAATILQTETWVGDKTGINIPLSVSPTIYDRFNDTVLDRAGQTIEVR